ncbi:MAG: hypothetical protein K2X60_02855 [Xanthobacteraceae bacterium]|nr:hypothetical protein [Xanthobacteraceae bacterium]
MKAMTVVALGAAMLADLVTVGGAAHAQDVGVRERGRRPVVIIRPDRPYWDSYIVPRYRYRPEDDRVDPCGGPVVPVIRYGAQEIPVPLSVANEWGYPVVHGRDWPCGRQRR